MCTAISPWRRRLSLGLLLAAFFVGGWRNPAAQAATVRVEGESLLPQTSWDQGSYGPFSGSLAAHTATALAPFVWAFTVPAGEQWTWTTFGSYRPAQGAAVDFYDVKLDSGAWTTYDMGGAYGAVVGQVQYGLFSAGAHTVSVRSPGGGTTNLYADYFDYTTAVAPTTTTQATTTTTVSATTTTTAIMPTSTTTSTTTVPTSTTTTIGQVIVVEMSEMHAELLVGLGLLIFLGSASLVGSWRRR